MTYLSSFILVGASVLGNISNIKGDIVEFENMNERTFDAIVFATGYKSTANMWLKVHSNVNVWSFLTKIIMVLNSGL